MSDFWFFSLFWTVAGSALGGLARYELSGRVAERWGERFPFGTLVVNAGGAFLIGLIAFLPWQDGLGAGVAEHVRYFLMYGFLGGFTTVSTFSLQTLHLLQEGELQKAAWNVFLSAGLCFAAVAGGAALGTLFT